MRKNKSAAITSVSMKHEIEITDRNPAVQLLTRKWVCVDIPPDTPLGILSSLSQASDALVTIVTRIKEEYISVGSGVMIGPGLVLTATHVLDEISSTGGTPLILSFLPSSHTRAWLAVSSVNTERDSSFVDGRRVKSDLALVSCDLHSDAVEDYPLTMIPICLCLPLPGDMLSAVGFRQGIVSGGDTGLTPLCTSGVVTNVFPQGRDERMDAPCLEVNMETIGGMSGGPVFNSDGMLVGVVSSSFDGGPTYVTLVWDAMVLNVEELPKDIWKSKSTTIHEARKTGLVKITGEYRVDKGGNIKMSIPDEASKYFTRWPKQRTGAS